MRKRVQQKSTNTAEARDSEQKLPTGSTRIQIYIYIYREREEEDYKYRRILKVLVVVLVVVEVVVDRRLAHPWRRGVFDQPAHGAQSATPRLQQYAPHVAM